MVGSTISVDSSSFVDSTVDSSGEVSSPGLLRLMNDILSSFQGGWMAKCVEIMSTRQERRRRESGGVVFLRREK